MGITQETFPKLYPGRPGFSVFRGVLVCWDGRYDGRIVRILECLPNDLIAQMLMVQVRKEQVSFIWNGAMDKQIETVCRQLVDQLPGNPTLAKSFRKMVVNKLQSHAEGSEGHDCLLELLESIDHYLATER